MATPVERIDDLDSHLNPPPEGRLDFLAGQEEPKPKPEPSGIHDFSEVGRNPMDNLDLSAIPPSAPVIDSRHFDTEKPTEEVFPIPRKLKDYINSLPAQVPKRSLLHSMEDMPKTAIIRVLGSYYAKNYLTEQEYNTALGLLDDSNKKIEEVAGGDFEWPPREEDLAKIEVIDLWKEGDSQQPVQETQTEKNHEIVSDPASEPVIEPVSETTEAETDVAPEVEAEAEVKDEVIETKSFDTQKQELISYIRSLMKLDIGPQMILEILEKKDISREEVLVTLSDAFNHLKILSEEEYKKSLKIMGEPDENDISPAGNFPDTSPEFKAEATSLDAGVVPDEPKTETVDVDETLEVDHTLNTTAEDHKNVDETPNPVVEETSEVQKQEVEEAIKNNLEKARENYARAKIEFSKKNSSYNKIKGSLGALLSGGILSGRSKEKSPTEIELEEAQINLNEAMTAYIKEKAARNDEIVDMFETEVEAQEKNGQPLTPEREKEIVGQIKIKLLEQAEKEWDLLQGQIAELSLPESEKIKKIKEMTAKGLKVWSKVPLAARLAVAPILIGTGVGLTAGLGAGALYAGTRLGRGLGGSIGSRIAGSLYDKRADRINAEAHEQTVSSYTDENSGKSFEEKEVAYMKAREEEAKRKNSQRIKKAMVMVGAGAGAGILTGLTESALSSGGAVSASGSVETINKPKVGSFDGVIKPKSNIASVTESIQNKQEGGVSGIIDKPETKVVPESVKAPVIISATVELSPKGFLQDIHNLKANIIKQYGDNIPEEIKTKIINKPTIEIAKEYGLYKPGELHESAVGYAGEKLSLDTEGHLIIERIDGTKETLPGLEGESIKAVVPEVETNTPRVQTGQRIAPIPVDTEVIPAKPIPELHSAPVPVEPVTIPDEVEVIPHKDIIQPETSGTVPLSVVGASESGKMSVGLDVINNAGSKTVVLNGVEIAHEEPFGAGKIITLDKKFQDGVQYKSIRESFVQAFEKNVTVDQVGQNPTTFDFEGGKIYIVQGLKDDPTGIRVLLNGKEIAKGTIDTTGSVVGPKLKFNSGLGDGWFFSHNAYERAFEFTKKALSIK